MLFGYRTSSYTVGRYDRFHQGIFCGRGRRIGVSFVDTMMQLLIYLFTALGIGDAVVARLGNNKDFLVKVISQSLPYIDYPRSLNVQRCVNEATKNKKRRNIKMKDVMILTGAGQIGMAIARRMGYGKKIVVGDKKMENAQTISKIMNEAGFDAVPVEMDLSFRDSIMNMIAEARKYGEISMLVNAAGVSPSQAPVEAILKVDLYGTAVLLEEVGKIIKEGGVGVTISSQSGWRMPALTAEEDELLATTPTEELLNLPLLQTENIRDTLHAYQIAKRCNEKRVMAEAVKWGKRGARINDIAPGIIVTPLAIDEFNGLRGDFYKNMFANCPAGRPGTADEVANVAELLMSDKGAFITGSTFLIDGGATASYFYGPLAPEK